MASSIRCVAVGHSLEKSAEGNGSSSNSFAVIVTALQMDSV